VLDRISTLLKEKMGLDAASIGDASVERAARARLAATGLQDLSAYWEMVSASDTELQELIEAVVVPETWFFRDAEAFAALVRAVREDWLQQHAAGATLRILSIPCSTGEEPYTIAMALLDAGIPPQRFSIDAVDISLRAIARAERGIYGKNSFRGKDLGFRERYFTADGAAYRVNDAVRQQVRFRHGNLLASGWLPGSHAYEAIFCRNVLIYFDRPTQDRAVAVLSRLMTPSGRLFVGPSESGLLLDHGFASAQMPRAFAFRKGAKPPPVVTAPLPTAHRPSRGTPPAAPHSRPAPRPAPRPAAAAPQEPANASAHWIEEAQRLANAGELIKAMQFCEQHLRHHPASADAFYLIGLLHDAASHVRKAAEYYRKALYLDPKHHEALVHLAVVLEKDGDAQGAKRLFERAQRSHVQTGSTRQ
jgi:chemotaxis protein methyltransferase WspC